MMKDYRALTLEQQRAVMESAAKLTHASEEVVDPLLGWVRGPLPPDRKGLIAAVHPQCLRLKDEVTVWNEIARATAIRTGQRVYTVITNTRWFLLLFGSEQRRDGYDTPVMWYDENEGGVYADDHYIAHYDPDGSWKLDGVS